MFRDCVGFYPFCVYLRTQTAAQSVWTQQRGNKFLAFYWKQNLCWYRLQPATLLISFLHLARSGDSKHIIC